MYPGLYIHSLLGMITQTISQNSEGAWKHPKVHDDGGSLPKAMFPYLELEPSISV